VTGGTPLKRLASVVAGQSPPSAAVQEFTDDGIPFLQGNAEFGAVHPSPRHRCDDGPRVVPADALLVSVRAPVGALNIADREYAIGRGLAAVIPGHELEARYVWWWLHASVSALKAECTGSTYDAVTADDIRRLPVPERDVAEQRAIADFLDAETARIDALITKKHDLKQRLEARWEARVRRVALMSGFPFVPIRRLWTVTDCKHRTPAYVDAGIPVVSPGDVAPGRLNLRECTRFVGVDDYRDLTAGVRQPNRGDVIYSRNASIGIAAYVDTDERFTMGQDVCLIRSQGQDQLWLMYMLNSVGVDQLQAIKIGSTFDRVNIAQLMDLRIPAPPVDEQTRQARRLDRDRQTLDRVRGHIDRQIALLRERRQALITAAVTGEITVPGTAA